MTRAMVPRGKSTFTVAQLTGPGAMVGLYLFLLGFSAVFVSQEGESTYIDEFFLLLLAPLAVHGLWRLFVSDTRLAILLLTYFLFAGMSGLFAVTIWYENEIPVMAPLLGIVLDAKFVIFLGALIALSWRSHSNAVDITVFICKAIVLVALVHAVFITRDIFSAGSSLSGIPLRDNPIYGYIPIGLLSHKVHTAMLSALALASAVVLLIYRGSVVYAIFALMFAIILLLSISLKELTIIAAVVLVVMRLSLFKSRKGQLATLCFMGVTLSFVLLIPVIWPYLEGLVVSRVDAYIHQESVRGFTYWVSMQIANDFFPWGSGAGTFASAPSRMLYFSPLYDEYGLSHMYGASPEAAMYLMDTGWPKFIAEAGWIGGGAYVVAYLVIFVRVLKSFMVRPDPVNTFGMMLGVLIFSSALGSAVFAQDLGLVSCALFFLTGIRGWTRKTAGVVNMRMDHGA